MAQHTPMLALVACALVLAIGLGAIPSARDSAAQLTQVDNESLTVNYSAAGVSVDETPPDGLGYDETVTVRNDSGEVLLNGTDYEWRPFNGSVRFVNTSNTTDDSSATITYRYQDPPAEEQTYLRIVGTIFSFLPYFIFALLGWVVMWALGWL